MSRVVTGSLLGAGGATAWWSGIDFTRFLPRGSWDVHHQPWHTGGQDVEELRRLVEQLSRNIGNGPTTVVIPGHQQGGSNNFLILGIITATGIVYVRVWKGWNLGDLMYVTKASLQQSVDVVTTGVDQVREYVTARIPLLQRKVEGLDRKQDEVLQAQEELQGQVGEVHDSLTSVQARLADMESNLLQNQDYANQGIHLLCKVVGELVRGGNAHSRTQSLQDLDRFVKHPRSLASNVSGFETLLGPQEEGRCRLIRASSAAVDSIKAVEHPGSLAALEQASAEQAAAEQGPRNRSPRVTYPPDLPPAKRSERVAWPREGTADQAGAKRPSDSADSLARSRSDWLPLSNRAGTRS